MQFRKWKPAGVLTDVEILFGFSTTSRVPLVFTTLLGVLRHHIWLARNSHRFDGVAPNVPATLRKARSTFRFLVRMHRRHCRPPDQFLRDWLVDGIIGSVTFLRSSDWVIDCSYTVFSHRYTLRSSGLYLDIIVYSELFYNYFVAVLLRRGTM